MKNIHLSNLIMLLNCLIVKQVLIILNLTTLLFHVFTIYDQIEIVVTEEIFNGLSMGAVRRQSFIYKLNETNYSKLRFRLITLMVIHCLASSLGLFGSLIDSLFITFLYSFILMITFIIELNFFSFRIKFSCLFFNYLTVIYSFLILLSNS